MRTRVVVLCVALLLSAGAVARADRSENVPLRASLDTFPMRLDNWQGTNLAPFRDEVLRVLGLTDYLTRNYYNGTGAPVDLQIGYWQSQKQGDTIHSPQNCLPAAGWAPTSQGTIFVADPRNPGSQVPVNRYVVERGPEKDVVLYWYQSHGRILASEDRSKFFLIADAMRLNRTDGAIVRVVVPVLNDTPGALADADKEALAFVGELLPQVDTFLPR